MTDIAVADLNNDGFLDYVVGNVKGGLNILTDPQAILSQNTINQSKQNVQIYPNPAHQHLNIVLDYPTTETVSFTCYNALGQALLQSQKAAGEQQYQLDISNLPAGIYFLQLETANKQISAPFVKQ